MKLCTQCGREYDNTMSFCLDDGSELLYGPRTIEEPATALLHETASPAEMPTRAQIHTTEHSGAYSRDVMQPTASGRGFDKRWLAAPLLLAVAVASGILGYRYFRPVGSGQISSIAVLPFQNRNSDADSEYLSDGLAESLIYRLSQIPDLKVSPRSSVFRYKGQDVDAEKVGADLGVDAVMSGRLIQRGDNLTISVDLIDVRNKKTLWGEQYERKMSDLLATQRDIASTISEKLQLKLGGSDSKGITSKYTDNNEAYQLYLKGRFYWNKRTGENISKAIEILKAATEKDPNFALAYSALADCYVVSPVYSRQRPDEAFALARSNANRAIELDPTLAEPHTALAMVDWFNGWDKETSEREYLRSIELNPNYPTAHQWYSRFLRSFKRSDEAWREIKRAEELDPLSLIFINNVAEQQIERGDYDGAAATCRRMIELDPSFWAVHQTLVWLYVKEDKLPDALNEARSAVEMSGRSNSSLAQLGHVLGKLGKRSEAVAIEREIEDKFANGTADARDVAIVYAGLDNRNATFEWLEKAYAARSFNLANLNMELLLDPLGDDPRMADLKRRIGIP
ncbi:MAG TPA: hypothetical protein VLI65_01590 [Pyrinomonadaceae bacterium]|nr:hypothetical protein [Pyrinomonadaceae bacterium]